MAADIPQLVATPLQVDQSSLCSIYLHLDFSVPVWEISFCVSLITARPDNSGSTHPKSLPLLTSTKTLSPNEVILTSPRDEPDYFGAIIPPTKHPGQPPHAPPVPGLPLWLLTGCWLRRPVTHAHAQTAAAHLPICLTDIRQVKVKHTAWVS